MEWYEPLLAQQWPTDDRQAIVIAIIGQFVPCDKCATLMRPMRRQVSVARDVRSRIARTERHATARVIAIRLSSAD